MNTSDFLVLGAGIIGISIARELKRRHADLSITVREQEHALLMVAGQRAAERTQIEI